MIRPPPSSTLFPSPPLFRSQGHQDAVAEQGVAPAIAAPAALDLASTLTLSQRLKRLSPYFGGQDRKSTRLNSSHLVISYAVFCLKKKKKPETHRNVSTWLLA